MTSQKHGLDREDMNSRIYLLRIAIRIRSRDSYYLLLVVKTFSENNLRPTLGTTDF